MSDRRRGCLAAWLVLGCVLAGCDAPPEPAQPVAAGPRGSPGGEPQEQQLPPGTSPAGSTPAEPDPTGRAPSADLPDQPVDSEPRWVPNLPRLQVDDARAATEGIRRLAGEHITLYTDIPPSEEIDLLPGLFDLAFPQWCEYFGVDPTRHCDWKLSGFVMDDKVRFQRAGLLPRDLPAFENGYARNYELWMYDQPSDYYRRHLLLHEGTHAFMNATLGGCGRPWYMEGIAELLATHRWEDGQLTLGQIPADRDEVPYWGRIRIVCDEIAAHGPVPLESIVGYPANAFSQNAPYAWSWAAAALLDGHPRYQERFRRLHTLVLRPDFNDRFRELIGDDWDQLREEWQLAVTSLEYGHDFARTAVDFASGEPLPPDGAEVAVAADRGWQNSRLRLDGGAGYRLQASGRYQVAQQPQVWWCEPGGVSIRYYRGRPLGILLAAVRPDRTSPESSPLLRPIIVGLEATLNPVDSGTLYLRINDSAAELHDNAGELKVQVRLQ